MTTKRDREVQKAAALDRVAKLVKLQQRQAIARDYPLYDRKLWQKDLHEQPWVQYAPPPRAPLDQSIRRSLQTSEAYIDRLNGKRYPTGLQGLKHNLALDRLRQQMPWMLEQTIVEDLAPSMAAKQRRVRTSRARPSRARKSAARRPAPRRPRGRRA